MRASTSTYWPTNLAESHAQGIGGGIFGAEKEVKMFEGSRLKIKRAEKHVMELNGVISAFISDDFYRFSVKEDRGHYFLNLSITKDIPNEIPLILGDAIHNLHSALDLAAYDIVSASGATPTRNCYFPFRQTRNELESTVKTGEIKAGGQKIIDLFINSIKPYRGGNDALYGLHDLDIVDKHRIVIPVIHAKALANVTLIGERFIMSNCYFNISQGGEINIIQVPGNFRFAGQAKPVFQVSFANGQPFDGQAVVPTVQQLCNLIGGIIDDFNASMASAP